MKSVRGALSKTSYCDTHSATEVLKKILSEDDENRFQVVSADDVYSFIRATYGHDHGDVQLWDINPSSQDLNWYIVTSELGSSAYVEATSEEIVKLLLDTHAMSQWNTVTVTETEDAPYLTRGPEPDSLSQKNAPNAIFFQSARKPFKVERRVNQAGDSGRYVTHHSGRVTERLPEDSERINVFENYT